MKPKFPAGYETPPEAMISRENHEIWGSRLFELCTGFLGFMCQLIILLAEVMKPRNFFFPGKKKLLEKNGTHATKKTKTA